MNCRKSSAYGMRLILFHLIILPAVVLKPWKLFHGWGLRLQFSFWGIVPLLLRSPHPHTSAIGRYPLLNAVVKRHGRCGHFHAQKYYPFEGDFVSFRDKSTHCEVENLKSECCFRKLLYKNQEEREIKDSFKTPFLGWIFKASRCQAAIYCHWMDINVIRCHAESALSDPGL